jgi:hypothetical protein
MSDSRHASIGPEHVSNLKLDTDHTDHANAYSRATPLSTRVRTWVRSQDG